MQKVQSGREDSTGDRNTLSGLQRKTSRGPGAHYGSIGYGDVIVGRIPDTLKAIGLAGDPAFAETVAPCTCEVARKWDSAAAHRLGQNCKPKNTMASGTGETAIAMVAMVASGEKMPLRPAISMMPPPPPMTEFPGVFTATASAT
jgi:hypothetical protein